MNDSVVAETLHCIPIDVTPKFKYIKIQPN